MKTCGCRRKEGGAMRPLAYAPTDTSKGIVLMGVMVKVCSTSFSMITLDYFRELLTLGIIFSNIPLRRLKLETRRITPTSRSLRALHLVLGANSYSQSESSSPSWQFNP